MTHEGSSTHLGYPGLDARLAYADWIPGDQLLLFSHQLTPQVAHSRLVRRRLGLPLRHSAGYGWQRLELLLGVSSNVLRGKSGEEGYKVPRFC